MANNEHDGMKKCSKCGEWKPATAEFFYRDKTKKGGLRTQCMECVREYRLEHYQKNRDLYLERHREYRQKNRDRRREYYQKNKDKIAELQRKYLQQNKQKST